MKFKFTILIFSLLLQSACSSYEAMAIDKEKFFQDLNQKDFSEELITTARDRLEATGLLENKNISFSLEDGLNLHESFLIALCYNPNLAIAREEINSQQHLLQAVSGIGKVKFNLHDMDGPSDRRIKATLMFDINALFGDDVKEASIDIASAELLVAQLKMHEAQWQLYSFLREHFAQLAIVRNKKDSLIALKEKYQTHVGKSAEALKKHQRSTHNQHAMHLTFLSQIDTNLSDTQTEEAHLRHDILERIGLMPHFKTPLNTEQSSYELDGLEDSKQLEIKALARRWDIQLLLASYEVREQRLRKAVAEQYPRLSLGPTFRFGHGSDVFGGALSLTFADQGQIDGKIKSEEAKRAQTRYKIEKRLLKLSHQIDHHIHTLMEYQKNSARWKNQALPALSDASEAGIKMLGKNPKTLGEVVETFAYELKGFNNYWALKKNEAQSAMELERALGFPLFEESRQ